MNEENYVLKDSTVVKTERLERLMEMKTPMNKRRKENENIHRGH